jgi:hypothetical protein
MGPICVQDCTQHWARFFGQYMASRDDRDGIGMSTHRFERLERLDGDECIGGLYTTAYALLQLPLQTRTKCD